MNQTIMWISQRWKQTEIINHALEAEDQMEAPYVAGPVLRTRIKESPFEREGVFVFEMTKQS